jgi:hypothetical protein
MFWKQKCSPDSYLIVGKEKSEKNQFAKILELFEIFDEVFFLDFCPHKVGGACGL